MQFRQGKLYDKKQFHTERLRNHTKRTENMDMRTLYLECNMGAAGDMLAAALLELHPEPEAVLERLNDLGLPGVSFQKERAASCGITGTHFSVRVNGVEEESHDVEMRHVQEGHPHHHEDHVHEHGEHHHEAHVYGEHHHIHGEHHHKDGECCGNHKEGECCGGNHHHHKEGGCHCNHQNN